MAFVQVRVSTCAAPHTGRLLNNLTKPQHCVPRQSRTSSNEYLASKQATLSHLASASYSSAVFRPTSALSRRKVEPGRLGETWGQLFPDSLQTTASRRMPEVRSSTQTRTSQMNLIKLDILHFRHTISSTDERHGCFG